MKSSLWSLSLTFLYCKGTDKMHSGQTFYSAVGVYMMYLVWCWVTPHHVLSTICSQIIRTLIPVMLLLSLVFLGTDPWSVHVCNCAPMGYTPRPGFLSARFSILRAGIAGVCHQVWPLDVLFTSLCIAEGLASIISLVPPNPRIMMKITKLMSRISTKRSLFTSTLKPETPFLMCQAQWASVVNYVTF